MIRRLTLAALATAALTLSACMPAMPTAEQAAAQGVKPASPQVQATIDRVLARAQPRTGQPFSRGMRLDRAYALGNTIFFDVTMTDELMAAAARGRQGEFQSMAGRRFGQRFCRAGSSTRAFLDAGGAIQLVIRDSSAGVLSANRLTGCGG